MAEIFSSVPGGCKSGISSEQDLAGFWRRLIAAVIDLVIIIILAATAAAYLGLGEGWRMLLMMVRRTPVIADDGTIMTSFIPMPAATFLLVAVILIPWFYYAILESSKNQATLGKMACRIQVSDLHGSPITFARATLRHFSKILSFFLLFAGFICINYTAHKQGLHDVIAACLVWYKREIVL